MRVSGENVPGRQTILIDAFTSLLAPLGKGNGKNLATLPHTHTRRLLIAAPLAGLPPFVFGLRFAGHNGKTPASATRIEQSWDQCEMRDRSPRQLQFFQGKQPPLQRRRHSLRPILRVQLPQYVRDVRLHRLVADFE